MAVLLAITSTVTRCVTRCTVYLTRPQLPPLLLTPLLLLLLQVWRNKTACFTRPTCGACSRAWGATTAPYVVTLYFRDPVQLATIAIRQVNAPAVKTVSGLRLGLQMDGRAVAGWLGLAWCAYKGGRGW